jgi:hypothetical protein
MRMRYDAARMKQGYDMTAFHCAGRLRRLA